MQSIVHLLSVVLTIVTFLAFAGAFLVSFRLTRSDYEIEHERQEPPGFRWFPTKWPAVVKEDYPEDLRASWVFRDRCTKTFVICVGVFALLAVFATVVDVPLFPK